MKVTVDEIMQALKMDGANFHRNLIAEQIKQHGIAPPDGYCIVPIATLKHWRELVDLNPKDLAPRIEAYIKDNP